MAFKNQRSLASVYHGARSIVDQEDAELHRADSVQAVQADIHDLVKNCDGNDQVERQNPPKLFTNDEKTAI